MAKKKVMIVDDEEDFLKITKLNLELSGKYEVLTLLTAKDIVSRMNEFKPDVILLDYLMPGLDGMEACKMLNDDPLGRITPIIMISAMDKKSDRDKAYKLGVVDYLSKPIDTYDIITKIDKALQYR